MALKILLPLAVIVAVWWFVRRQKKAADKPVVEKATLVECARCGTYVEKGKACECGERS